MDADRNAVKPAVVLKLQDVRFIYQETIQPTPCKASRRQAFASDVDVLTKREATNLSCSLALRALSATTFRALARAASTTSRAVPPICDFEFNVRSSDNAS